jgi:hypothetical protein
MYGKINGLRPGCPNAPTASPAPSLTYVCRLTAQLVCQHGQQQCMVAAGNVTGGNCGTSAVGWGSSCLGRLHKTATHKAPQPTSSNLC